MLNEQSDEPDSNAEDNMPTQLSMAERDIGRTFDPGARAFFIIGVMLVLVASWVLPWIGSATGWQVLVGRTDPALEVDLLARLFSINSTAAGILLGTLALTTRRWAVAFVAAMGCSIVALEGIMAIWSRQTVPQAGPAIGLILAVICMFVLASQWLKIAWSRP